MSKHDEFISVFIDIEKEIKSILEIEARSFKTFSAILNEGAKNNQLINGLKSELKLYAEIRNLISHESKVIDSFIIKDETIEGIKVLLKKLKNPPLANSYTNANLMTCDINDKIDEVLVKMIDHKFSQVPVIKDKLFVGLLTTNTISFWMGASIAKESIINHEDRISLVLKYAEEANNVEFISRHSNAYDIITKFENKLMDDPLFDALLITENGRSSEKLLGIITKSDLPQIYRSIK